MVQGFTISRLTFASKAFTNLPAGLLASGSSYSPIPSRSASAEQWFNDGFRLRSQRRDRTRF